MLTLTRSEEEIMQIIWKIGPCTVGQVRTYMEEKLGLDKPAHTTVSTFLKILVDKNYLEYKEYGRTFEYYAKVSQKEYSKKSLKKFIHNYFDNSPKALMSFLIKENDLSLKDLQDIFKLLNKNK